MTSGGVLCSDHVNYLILRYLQEVGHESAATALYRDWHRQPEFRDPENYPFAPVVRRGELISVIQDGLHHDELVAKVKKNERKFNFTAVNAREDGLVENGVGGSRPGSSGASMSKRKGRPPVARQQDDFPTPAPKRQRRSEGSEGVHLNGDAMDVDAASASVDPDDDGEAASPAVASEPEAFDVPERYDSVHIGIQTDELRRTKTSTMAWKIDKPGATILHSMWNPVTDPQNAKTLLAVGESLCRFYEIPEHMDGDQNVLSIDPPDIPSNSVVTATAWHPHGHTAVYAVESIRELPDGRTAARHSIVTHSVETGGSSRFHLPPNSQSPGIVLALRYSSNGDYLLAASVSNKLGAVFVYDTSSTNATHDHIASRRLEHQQVLDVAWCGQDEFIACGGNGLAERCTLDPDARATEDGEAEPSATHGLKISSPSELTNVIRKWDKVRYDDRTGILVLASSEDGSLLIGDGRRGLTEGAGGTLLDLPGQLTALAFQPCPTAKATAPLLLAATFEEGMCVLYSHDLSTNESAMKTELTLRLTDSPALALAWSHDGAFLAVGGTEVVQIWETDALIKRDEDAITRAQGDSLGALVTWRPSAEAPANGELENIGNPLTESSLSWSADGESLAFAVDKQIAIIRFRPPLRHIRNDEHEGAGEVNGHVSPAET